MYLIDIKSARNKTTVFFLVSTGRKMRNPWILGMVILPWLMVTTSALHLKENVIFNKVKEVSLSRSSWKLTMIVDLDAYDLYFVKTLNYIKELEEKISTTYKKFEDGGHVQLTSHFLALRDELKLINNTREKIKGRFDNYRALHVVSKRSVLRKKRALLPFVGSIYSFLFGLTSESDMKDIRQAINDLGDNQDGLRHVVQKSLSVMNKSQHEIIENRNRINKLNQGISVLTRNLDNLSIKSQDAIYKINNFLQYYLHLNSLTNSAQELIIEMVQFFEDLGRQIDMLANGELTPVVIAPIKLKDALIKIEQNLPEILQLPVDPTENLWAYYQTIKCATMIEDNKVIIILNIPLINLAEKMDIYEVINLPLPNLKLPQLVNNLDTKSMLAAYDLEAHAFAIDTTRTRYSLLTKEEVTRCTSHTEGFCQFISPLYPSNVSKFCVIAVYCQS